MAEARTLADAWDEGRAQGIADVDTSGYGGIAETPNPYRQRCEERKADGYGEPMGCVLNFGHPGECIWQAVKQGYHSRACGTRPHADGPECSENCPSCGGKPVGQQPEPERWRCVIAGCNPKLDERTAAEHKESTGHRVARWPQRSAEGERRAAERNSSGYYRKYN